MARAALHSAAIVDCGCGISGCAKNYPLVLGRRYPSPARPRNRAVPRADAAWCTCSRQGVVPRLRVRVQALGCAVVQTRVRGREGLGCVAKLNWCSRSGHEGRAVQMWTGRYLGLLRSLSHRTCKLVCCASLASIARCSLLAEPLIAKSFPRRRPGHRRWGRAGADVRPRSGGRPATPVRHPITHRCMFLSFMAEATLTLLRLLARQRRLRSDRRRSHDQITLACEATLRSSAGSD